MTNELYDVVVIGGGPAGYIAAIKAAKLGGNVALVERGQLGGTCLNRGCIPTKTYLKNAEMIASVRECAKRGIVLADPTLTVDMPKWVSLKNRVVKRLTAGVGVLLREHNVTIVQGEGRIEPLESPGNGGARFNVQVHSEKGDGGEATVLATKNVIAAGGSKVGRLPIPGLEDPRVLTSDTILDLKELPDSLAILGGGVIGIEMARIFSATGVKTTIVEREPRLAPMLDVELSDALAKTFKREKVDVRTGVEVEEIQFSDDGASLVLAGGETINAAAVLLSVGRVPDESALEGLDLEREGRAIRVDGSMRTSIPGLYAPGDVNAQNMLAHAAFKMGEVAAQDAMGHAEHTVASDPVELLKYTPGVIYGEPEAACVGLTESQAKEQHGEIRVGRFPFQANGRAIASGQTDGFVKVIADAKYGEILGVHIYGPCASELINEAATLMAAEATIEELAEAIHAHPTLSETLMEAAADALERCLHLPPKKG